MAKSLLITFALAVAFGCAVMGTDAVLYRYVSVAKYNTTANVSNLSTLERTLLKNCSRSFVAAVTGIANVSYNPKGNWGSLVKVIDFANASAYASYKACDDAFPSKPFINSFVIGKLHGFAPIADASSIANYANGSIYHVGLSNVTSFNITGLRTNLTTQFAGKAVIDSVPGVFNLTLPANVSRPSNLCNHTNILVGNVPNVMLSYYYFKNGNNATSVPVLPLYSTIKALQIAPGGQDTEFQGYRV